MSSNTQIQMYLKRQPQEKLVKFSLKDKKSVSLPPCLSPVALETHDSPFVSQSSLQQ